MYNVLDIKLSAKQIDFMEGSTSKINICHGAVRSGKTFVTNLRWLQYMVDGPEGKLLMSGKTKQTIKENVLDDLFALVGLGNWTYNQGSGEAVILDRLIKVVGAGKIDSEGTIRGQTYAGWYGDEITLQHATFVKQAITRCSVPGAQIFWTTNPDHPKHPIKSEFIDNKDMRKKGQVLVWHFLLTDNNTLTDDYKELLKSSFAGVFYKRNILGLWVIADGVVYGDVYNRNYHRIDSELADELISEGYFKEFIGGVDWGFTHPMVGMVVGVTWDNKFILIDEFYHVRKRTTTLKKWFLEWEEKLVKSNGKKFRIIYCDTAEPDRLLVLKAAGLPAYGCDKQISAGINSVMVAFAANELYVAKRCVNTDEELQVYRYPDPDEDPIAALKDLPLDEDNHAMDALRYLIHNHRKVLLAESRRSAKKVRPSRGKKMSL